MACPVGVMMMMMMMMLPIGFVDTIAGRRPERCQPPNLRISMLTWLDIYS